MGKLREDYMDDYPRDVSNRVDAYTVVVASIGATVDADPAASARKEDAPAAATCATQCVEQGRNLHSAARAGGGYLCYGFSVTAGGVVTAAGARGSEVGVTEGAAASSVARVMALSGGEVGLAMGTARMSAEDKGTAPGRL